MACGKAEMSPTEEPPADGDASAVVSCKPPKKSFLFALGAIVLVGLGAGFAGTFLIKVQQLVQAVAFGTVPNFTMDFFDEVMQASPQRRFLSLLACGLIGGVGWVLIHRKGSPLVSIKGLIAKEGNNMPFFTTLCHDLLQTATVAMGSPLGKEVAPRELSCAITGLWLKRTSFFKDERMRKIFFACAAGGGLAAIYNAPLGGTLFVLESLLLFFGAVEAGFAAITCGIAVAVTHLALGDVVTYTVPSFGFDNATLIFSLVIAPVLALAVHMFERTKKSLPELDRTSPKMILVSTLCFAGIGLVSVVFPLVLGNGQIGNEASFVGALTGGQALGYFLGKWGVVLLATLAGAYGGNIQPSIMMGGMLSFAVAALWNLAGLPPVSVATAAFVGGAIYLGLAQKMPVTAAAFLLELTRCSVADMLPVCLCLGLAVLCYKRLGDTDFSARLHAKSVSMQTHAGKKRS